MNKKSQQQIITTILLILLAIVIISIVSVIFLRMIRNKAEFDISSIDMEIDYGDTFFNPDQEIFYIRVNRNPGKGNITGVKLVVTTEGDSRTCIRDNYPNELETRIYLFRSFPYKPDSVQLAIIAESKGKEKIVVLSELKDIKTFSREPVIKEGEFGGGCGDLDKFPPEPGIPGE